MSSRTSRMLLTVSLAAFLAFGLKPVAAQTASPPVYPGAVVTARPAAVGLEKAPPPSAKTYATSDSFEKVRAWYRAHLNGAQELSQEGMGNYEDAFLVGSAPSGAVVMIEAYQGKTYIIIGPPV